ncbi:cold-shock protein [Ensifer aridi]|uniref:cold-shock protein n=1 Tax=Ensifer aridi TaxID=1708715 RepID=UPI000A105075|nr:cold-shock protein [Ensifer aridi]
MGRNTYGVGDTVVLRADLTRTAAADRTCRIVAILPSAEHGEAQYRVRFGTENFERRILEHDIDPSETALPVREGDPAGTLDGKPWLKPLSVRTGK